MSGAVDRTIATIVDTRRDTQVEPTSTNPFTLGFEFDGPAEPTEITTVLGSIPSALPLQTMWAISRSPVWFLDLQYGQWGLRLLAPDDVVARTAVFLRDRPRDAMVGDVVVGEFVGDLDLLVLTPSGSVLVALPLDPRNDWPSVAPSFESFLDRYDRGSGDKFWE